MKELRKNEMYMTIDVLKYFAFGKINCYCNLNSTNLKLFFIEVFVIKYSSKITN